MATNGHAPVMTFQKGSILKIRLRNFMTYSDVTMNCGPGLNLVIGPNGTGKSALVCGIIMGLGGDPSTTGRASSELDYIRYGQTEANIDIWLRNTRGYDYHIGRRLIANPNANLNQTSSGHGRRAANCKSEWTLNNAASNLRTVRQFCEEQNIRIDNLCQFLPQERVVEFAQLNSKDLLKSTEKAVGQADMFDNHNALSEKSKKLIELKEERKKLEYHTTVEEGLNMRDKDSVEKLRKKRKLQKKIELCKLKRPWVAYNRQKEKLQEIENSMEERKSYLRQCKEELKPIQVKIDKYGIAGDKRTEKLTQQVETNFAELNQDVSSQQRQLQRLNENTIIQDYKRRVEDDQRREQEIAKTKTEIEKYSNELEELKNREDINATENADRKIKEISNTIKNLRDKEFQRSDRMSNLRLKRTNLEAEFRQTQSSVRTMEDMAHRKEEMLKRQNRKAYDATVWLRQNQHLFKKTIHEPMLLSIQVQDPKFAAIVESAIPRRDLYMFITEDADDLIKFKSELRGRGLEVAVASVAGMDRISYEPTEPMSRLSGYGFTHYVTDLFTAPQTVKDYLCSLHQLHNIPVGGQGVEDNGSSIKKQFGHILHRYYSPEHVYNFIKSRYHNEIGVATDSFPKANLLNIPSNERELKAEKSKLERLNNEIKNLDEDIRDLRQEADQEAARLRELEHEKERIEQSKTLRQQYEQKIQRLEQKVVNLENGKIDLEAERKALAVKARENFLSKIQCYNNLTQYWGSLNRNAEEYGLSIAFIQYMSKFVEQLDQQAREARSKVGAAEKELLQLTTERRKKQEDIAQALEQVRGEFRRQETSFSGNKPSADLLARFEELPSSLEEIDDHIEDLQVNIDALMLTENDDATEQDYNKRVEIIRGKQSKMKEIDGKMAQISAEVEELKEKWLTPLEELVAKIDKNFSHLMGKLNYGGSVTLDKPNEDFEKYGIIIKVKYRESEELQELTTFQSGGERSVATMTYMIALQELTKVPFRCVDEINQGMDANNERRIFDLIVKTAADNSSQYFLFSPKLLKNLNYTENMNIQFIANGPELSAKWPESKDLHLEQIVAC